MIDPRNPDFSSTPASSGRAKFNYAPQGSTPPVVTVVTPYFNTGPVFLETAAAVLGSSLQQFEWLIINDASTDPAALAQLQPYRSGDPRIRVVDHPQNRGLSAARNTGFKNAQAPYVFLLDSDDLIEPTTLEKCAWFLASHPDVAFTKGRSVGFAAQQYLWDQGFESGPGFVDENRITATALLRKSVHAQLGGYDETIRGGFEDWEFWLRAAAAGAWGATIPEYLDWYRRRDTHAADWSNWSEGKEAFANDLKRRFGHLRKSFPYPRAFHSEVFETVRTDLPFANPLATGKRRILMVLPWFTMGGADKFNLRLVEQLTARGWEVTVVGTLRGDQSWMPEFSKRTPDVFALPHFLRPVDYPAFLRYLIDSRSPEVVLLSNSEHGYQVLPYLRSWCPQPAYVDYCHMEEEYWKNGGYPRYAATTQEALDLNIVSSEHLKQWMVDRGADASRIQVCYTDEDPVEWKRDPQIRREQRRALGLDDTQVVLLYAGRLTRQKQPAVFCETLRRLAEQGLAFTALVAGDGEDRGMMEAFVREHGLSDHVRFLGALPLSQMRATMMAADIFFLPSLMEGIALSIFEAMAMELAVVGADVGGQRELVIPECGVLLKRGEAEAERYAALLAALIPDPSRCREMGRKGRARIEQEFSLQRMGDRMVELFDLALKLRGDQPRQPVSRGLATELATRAVEFQRMEREFDALWSRLHTVGESPSGLSAAEELAHIQQLPTFRALERLKQTSAYRWVATLRWGDQWDRPDTAEPPSTTLLRIRESRSFRLVRRLESVRQTLTRLGPKDS